MGNLSSWRASVAALLCMVLGAPVVAATGMVSVPEGTLRELQSYVPNDSPELIDTLGLRDIAQFERAVPVQMRDGLWLSADLIMPLDASGNSKRPAILIKTPYVPGTEGFHGEVLRRLVKEGYVIAIANDRGTQWSEGRYHWLAGAKNDGYDTLTWMSQQPWSNGKIGTYGCSSPGENQLGLVTMNHPAHKAAVIMGAATGYGVLPGSSDQGVFYRGGVPSLDWAWWYREDAFYGHPILPRTLTQQERSDAARHFNSSPRGHFVLSPDLTWVSHLPSEEILSATGAPETEFNKLIRMTPGDPGWKQYDFFNDGDKTRVPSLHIDSWYDSVEAYGTAKGFEYLSSNSPNQYLIMGSTAHCMEGSETQNTVVGEHPVGDARFPYADQIVQFFDHWMKDDGGGRLPPAKVQYYLMSSDHWERTDAWPPAGGAKTTLYLHSQGRANSLQGDGQLSAVPPAGGEAADQYIYDPLLPVPTRGGGCCESAVSLDQTPVEVRNDVLVYSSAPLQKPLNVVGYVDGAIYFASSQPDTDLMLKLVDVFPDGKAYNVADTALRLRYRESMQSPRLLVKGQVYRIHLGGIATAIRFAEGHRVRIEITSSNFPGLERNLNTGGRNFDESNPQKALNSVYHTGQYPSSLELTIRP